MECLHKPPPPSFLSSNVFPFSSETNEGEGGMGKRGEKVRGREIGGDRAVTTNKHIYLLNTSTFPPQAVTREDLSGTTFTEPIKQIHDVLRLYCRYVKLD